MAISKKRHIISFDRMSDAVLDAFNEKYPRGLADCNDDIRPYSKPDGSVFEAVTIELPEDIYLVKIPMAVDSAEDVQKWLDRAPETEMTEMTGSPSSENDGNDTIPDEGMAQMGSEEDPDGEEQEGEEE